MKGIFFFIINLLVFSTVCFAQANGAGGRHEESVKKLKFCGYKYSDWAMVRKHFEQQLAFLEVNNGDTIVDIGSSSGAYIGAINVIAGFKQVHFILVDIDSNCLNAAKLIFDF